jgi:hypothetical protein
MRKAPSKPLDCQSRQMRRAEDGGASIISQRTAIEPVGF